MNNNTMEATREAGAVAEKASEGGEAAGSGSGGEEMGPEEIVERFKQMKNEIRRLAEKISELELDYNEHQYVPGSVGKAANGREGGRPVGGFRDEGSAMARVALELLKLTEARSGKAIRVRTLHLKAVDSALFSRATQTSPGLGHD